MAKKAWRVNPNKIQEHWHYSDQVVYAETRNDARSMYMSEYKWQLPVRYDGEELTYLNIPMVRAVDCDKLDFEGMELSQRSIDEIIRKREHEAHFEAIMKDESVQFVYIVKRGSYYSDNYNGYTNFQSMAGIYPKADAVKHSSGVIEITLKPVVIDHHNANINKQIDGLQKEIAVLRSRILTP